MSFEVTTAFVKQYSDNVMMLSQQKGSRLRACVRVETQSKGDDYYDQIGATAAKKRTARHSDTPLISTPHSRRKVSLSFYDWADLIDSADKVRMLNDPTSPYALAGAYAMGRAQDDEIILAASGTAFTGADGTTSVALPAGQKIVHGSAGLTIAKLLTAKEILDGSEADEDEERFIALSAKQVTNLLNTTEVKSADYNTVKALVAGQIDTFLGFKFKRTERLAKNASNNRLCLAWVKSGLLLAVGAEATGRISERDDKNYSTQVYYGQGVGSTRMEETKLVEIECTES